MGEKFRKYLKELGGLDFEVLKEEWGFYKLADGSLLRIKFVLVNVIKEGVDEAGNPIYSFSWTNVVGVISPENLRGEPSTRRYSPKELTESIVEEDLEFKTLREGASIYKLEDGTILHIRPVLVMVSRTNKCDSKGMPIYLVNVQPIIKPKRAKKKQK